MGIIVTVRLATLFVAIDSALIKSLSRSQFRFLTSLNIGSRFLPGGVCMLFFSHFHL